MPHYPAGLRQQFPMGVGLRIREDVRGQVHKRDGNAPLTRGTATDGFVKFHDP